MKKRIFEGSGVAIVTPFNENGVNFALAFGGNPGAENKDRGH